MSCDIAKGNAGGLEPIILSLQKDIESVVEWNFTDCQFGIQNFTVYVTKPRAKNGRQDALPPSTPLTLKCENLTTGATTACPGFICYMQTVSKSVVRLTLKAAKAMTVEVSYTAAFGGAP